ncbi:MULTISPECIES: hypothetical protein [unclassified Acinetobacter]|uniref:hypothetical protein n=1 Tax=unclassified Acinetobacter TaxID=196816 RepID=UPI0015D23C3B|nr:MULTISPECIES: hypothetical protein [unclassified Acinetobacter]
MKFYERVISDFGGYEKCKDILSQPNINFIMNAQGLREHMLEYRRQHNIFEVGDKVVYRNLPHERLFYVKAVLDGSIVLHECCDEVGARCFSEFEPYSDIQHANDEEIKAGKRLEVK